MPEIPQKEADLSGVGAVYKDLQKKHGSPEAEMRTLLHIAQLPDITAEQIAALLPPLIILAKPSQPQDYRSGCR